MLSFDPTVFFIRIISHSFNDVIDRAGTSVTPVSASYAAKERKLIVGMHSWAIEYERRRERVQLSVSQLLSEFVP